jgi:hypothetical protein
VSWTGQRWEILWVAVKDIALTGTGIVLILSQVFASSPIAAVWILALWVLLGGSR